MINITPLCDFGEMCTGEIVGSQNGRSFCVAHDPTGHSPALEVAKERVAKAEAAVRAAMTKPSEPSDEGKGGPIECICDDDMYGRRGLHMDTCWSRLKSRTEASESQLTEAQAELERVHQLVSDWADVANWLKSCGWHLPSFVHLRIGNLEAHIKGEPARPPSPPAAVETKPAACSVCGGDGYYKGPRLGDEPCPGCGGSGFGPAAAAQEQPASPNRSEPNNGYCAYGACVDMPWRNGLCKDHWRAPPAGEQPASTKLGGPNAAECDPLELAHQRILVFAPDEPGSDEALRDIAGLLCDAIRERCDPPSSVGFVTKAELVAALRTAATWSNESGFKRAADALEGK
jgi:hypothetical protein